MEKLYNALVATLIFSFIGILDADGQPLRNLNFEKPGIIAQTRPLDWNIFPVGYTVSLDSTKSQNGIYSLRSKRLPNYEHGSSFSRLQIPAELIRGKKVNLSGWISTQDIEDGFAIIWFDIIDTEGNFRRASLPDGGVTGTTNWQRFEDEQRIDTTAESAFISLFHSGSGTAWFDDFDILIDGVEYNPDMFDPWMASIEEIKWLEKEAIPLQSDAPGSGFEDLNTLQEIFNGAKIVGLGEATHGTREFFRMKHRFVEWFAQQADTTIFVIEASMPEARIVNEYVLYGKGDPKEALAGMHFWVWNSQEVLDLIEWMRDYNLSGEGRMEFWGNDLQFPLLATDSVEVFIEKADPEYLDQLLDHYATIRQTEDEELRRMSQEQLREI